MLYQVNFVILLHINVSFLFSRSQTQSSICKERYNTLNISESWRGYCFFNTEYYIMFSFAAEISKPKPKPIITKRGKTG